MEGAYKVLLGHERVVQVGVCDTLEAPTTLSEPYRFIGS